MSTIPLQKFPVARTASPGNLQDAVAELTGYNHDVVHATSSSFLPNGTVNGVRLGDLSLVFVAYAAHVSVLAPPTRDQVVFVIPLGPMAVEVAGHREVLTSPFALSASADSVMYPDPTAGALVGTAHVALVTDLLRDLFGADREFVIDLSKQRPIRLGAGSSLRKSWLGFALDPHSNDTDDLVDALLVSLAQYTNYRAEERVDWMTPPDYLVRAVRHLHTNLGDQVSLANVSELTGIGTRQMQLAFKSHLGCTAQEYLKTIRLERAHVLLTDRRSSKRKSVAEVSFEVGIPHQGRFAQYFSNRYGILPSAL